MRDESDPACHPARSRATKSLPSDH
ncbi:hypothetical protein MICRO116_490013 [Micrococcus sp. 116]|nr:hypothetical protein MICRO116_490013 [Micrococcus sp. 116]